MVDLGVKEGPNLLLDEASLSFAFDTTDRRGDGILSNADDYWYPYYAALFPPGADFYDSWNYTSLDEAYDQFKNITGLLGTNPTTILTDYACLEPTQRNIGTIVLAVILANLVFLQALWKVLNGIAGLIVLKKDPNAMICVGCQQAGYEALPRRGLARTTSHATDAESTKGLVSMTAYEMEPYEDAYDPVAGRQRNTQYNL
ncbi:hypothetical protein H2198_003681 [Neophaeococcomyces mojaviensis]|uniref:Uncharacterized protein n=1 Tax=Neophaeococcomyces mojaviensis TaxID=3383035 RepID=A0ACC3AAI5_9EURO|nr:hypothetical protein H2198_003681 [Knufia sp. JES_112]